MYNNSLSATSAPVYNLLTALCMTLALIAPDYLIKLFSPNVKVLWDFKSWSFIFLIASCLSFIEKRVLVYCVLASLFVMEIIQLHYLCYFGEHISAFNIDKVILDIDEIAESGFNAYSDLYFVFPIIVLCYGTAAYTVHRWRSARTYLPYAYISIIVLVCALGVRAVYRPITVLNNNPMRSSLYNSINSFSYYFTHAAVFGPVDAPKYEAYTIEKRKEQGAKNIVMIMGESLSSRHMSLYGYNRKTTPYLDQLRDSPNFVFKPGISSGLNTRVALVAFFNLLREPGNLEVLRKPDTNLFRLAKAQGYKTFWISAQKPNLLHNLSISDIDHIITRDGEAAKAFAERGDEALLDFVKNTELGEKNFIVLHQRSVHGPYESNYKYRPELAVFPEVDGRTQRSTNRYDNAVIFVDSVINQIVSHFEERFKGRGESYIFSTSDHGELLGEGGLYGHGILNPGVAEVPCFIYGINGSQSFLESVRQKPVLSHYDMGILIADRLGYQINNPNYNENEHFVHGNDLYADYQFLQGTVNSKGIVEFTSPLQLSSFNPAKIRG